MGGFGMEYELNQLAVISAEQVFEVLGSCSEGLSHAKAEARLAELGPNVILIRRRKSLILSFIKNFTHLMAILLWVGSGVALLAQLPQLSIAIALVNVINGAFSFWQEYKAEKATEALQRLLPVFANVLRQGEHLRVPAEQLVAGDVVLLAEGDRISADARLIGDAQMKVDQSTLTGESRLVRKQAVAVSAPSALAAEIPNLVFAGTSVTSGTARAVVYATGMQTQFGKIAGFTQGVPDEPSPLQKEMQRVTQVVTFIAVGMGVVFFLLASLVAGVKWSESFIFAMGMIVAFVPEGLLPTVTLSLAMGVQRMARRHALIKRLSAVETLGCTTVICTDKTGTLTQNEMTVKDLWLGGYAYTVTGVGYDPDGRILPAGAGAHEIGDTAGESGVEEGLRRLLLAASLCNNSRLLTPDDEHPYWRVLGDPTEAALKVAALKFGLDPDQSQASYPRLFELSFDSRRKRMSTVHPSGSLHPSRVSGSGTVPGQSGRMVCVKGAPREILALSSTIWWEGRELPLDDALKEQVLAVNDGYAGNGLRVLALAERVLEGSESFPAGITSWEPESIEKDLTFLGLAAMMDPPRPEVSEAVEKCHKAGIRVIMITGDYGLTAESIARRIGIIRGEKPAILTGADLDSMRDDELAEVMEKEVIFARVAPEHKLRVVQVLKDRGDIVAVTGDGVNDAPALKKADIGVAMGLSGTDVARETADMILTDDNFASIVNAIEEGRTVYSNIKKFAAYIFTSNTPEAVPFVLFALSQGRIPLALNVMHILTIDLGTDIMPALALGVEPPEPGIMDRPPRRLDEHVITRSLLLRAYLWLGLIQSTAVMGAFYLQYWLNGYWGRWMDLPAQGALYESATAMALACVVTTQIGNLFAQRTERSSVLRVGFLSNRLIWLGIFSELALILAVVYVPVLQKVIGTSSFAIQNWGVLLLTAPLLLLADEGRKALMRAKDRRKMRTVE
jgi:potassium/sodium efflux P-type ATPase